MITVCLYGNLREYGRRFKLHANSPAEALKALLIQIKGLKEALQQGSYQVRFGCADYSEDSLKDTFHQQGSGILHVVPRTFGAGKGGALNIIIGVVLVAVSWWMGGAAGWAYLGAAGYTGATMAFTMGVSMILGGVAQMLTKTATGLDSSSNSEKDSRNTSFSNLQNTAAQGQPVPLAYGRVRCGSRVISQGYSTRRLDTNTNAATDDPTVAVAAPITKTFYAPVATTAPDGSKYNIDLNDDSVRAANYTARVS